MQVLLVATIAILTVLLAGCEAVGTIFEAGIWVGVIGVIVLIALLGLLVSVFRR